MLQLKPWLIVTVGVFVGGLLGLWFYRSLVSHDSLPGPLGSLDQHFKTSGLEVKAQLVRHPQINEVHKNSSWQVPDGRLFYVYWCRSNAEAQTVLKRVQNAPSRSLNSARGPLVIFFTEWPANDPVALKVLSVFESWPYDESLTQ